MSFIDRLNAEWHETALRMFMVIVLAHWAEHLLQAFQIYALGWPVPEARGVLGYFFPWLDQVRDAALRLCARDARSGCSCCGRASPAFRSAGGGRSRSSIQFFHHIEHALLQIQAITGHNLFDRPVPTSIVQLWVPRVELHLFYNTIVFIPMVIAMYYHMFPAAVCGGAEVHVRVAPWGARCGLTPAPASRSADARFAVPDARRARGAACASPRTRAPTTSWSSGR